MKILSVTSTQFAHLWLRMPPDHRKCIEGLLIPHIDLSMFGQEALVLVEEKVSVTRLDPSNTEPSIIDVLDFIKQGEDTNESVHVGKR